MNWLHNVKSLARNTSQRARNPRWIQSKVVLGLKVVNFTCAMHLFANHVGWLRWVAGPSMLPTMDVEGEMIIENRMVSSESLQRGDLVTFLSPLDPSRPVCKRLIGLPGDIVCVDPTGKYAPSTEHVVIPKGHIWVSGDNMDWSRDSRSYGPVPFGLIKGKFVGRLLPWSKRTMFRNNFHYIEEN